MLPHNLKCVLARDYFAQLCGVSRVANCYKILAFRRLILYKIWLTLM